MVRALHSQETRRAGEDLARPMPQARTARRPGKKHAKGPALRLWQKNEEEHRGLRKADR